MKIPSLTNIYIPSRHAAPTKEQPPTRPPFTPTVFELFMQRMQKPATDATFGESTLTLSPTSLQQGKAASSAPPLQTVPQTYTPQKKVTLSAPPLQTATSDEQLAPDTEDELTAGPVLTPEEQERLLAGTERAISESQ
jgi:hypothetical protein